MKNVQMRLAVLLLSILGLLTGTYGQLTPTGDSYTNTAASTTNYGAKTLLDVESTQTTFIQFDLSSIPSGYTSADITKATLKLYVNAVTTAGSFNVDYVNGTWTESTIDASNAPALGTTIAASVPLTTADKNQYILVDVTAAVQAWLSGTANDGIALVANSPLNASFDSKESTTTSHSAELDIVFAGGGTLTGVTTASGSGLIGGGTSGTLNLSLTNACAANQVLQWNGTSWICAAVGTGTVASVAAGTGLTASPSPITGSGTLSINTAVVPQLNVANTFTGNQTVNGSVSATSLSASGTMTGATVNATTGFNLGGSLFAFGSYVNANAFLGFAGNSTNTSGSNNTASGYLALFNNTSSYNTASGYHALYANTTGGYNTAIGVSALNSNSMGYYNAAIGFGAGQTISGGLTGSNNTAVGAGAAFGTGSLTNATAIGSNAEVTESNALVLGAISGVNGGTSVNVGIGTTAPGFTLDVNGVVNATTSFDIAGTPFVFGSNSNVFLGFAGNFTTNGAANTASGAYALFANATGGFNTASGYAALEANTRGGSNTAGGALALASNTTGSENTAFGYSALFGNTGGNDLTCVGYSCSAGADGLSNATAIGAHAVVGASNTLVLGGTGQYAVKVGIGTATPSNVLTIAQGAGQPLSDGWATFSSRRWKTNIHTLHGALEKVEQLRGVSYDLKANGQHEVGVIAEEVGAVVPEVVTWEKNGTDAQSVDYGRLTALLIEATKEQQALIREQKEQIRAQQAQINEQQTQVSKLTSELRTIQSTLKSARRGDIEVRTQNAARRVSAASVAR